MSGLILRAPTAAERALLDTILEKACIAASAADVSPQVFAIVTARAVAAIVAQFIEPADRQRVLDLVITDLRGSVADLSAQIDADYGFVLANPVAFVEPIPCRGMLGFFTLPDDVLALADAAEVRS